MCGVENTNHNDEPYIKPVEVFLFTNGIPLEPFVFLPRRKNSSAAHKCQPSENSRLCELRIDYLIEDG